MIIELREIPPDGKRTYEGEDENSVLAIENEREYVQADKLIRYRLTACVVSARLIVAGSVWTEVLFRCSRCLEYFRREVRDESFERAIELSQDMASVDLTGDIRETILLHFPGHPVCRGDCKGLCAQCGTNLNVERCDCRPARETRWGAWDKLVNPGG